VGDAVRKAGGSGWHWSSQEPNLLGFWDCSKKFKRYFKFMVDGLLLTVHFKIFFLMYISYTREFHFNIFIDAYTALWTSSLNLIYSLNPLPSSPLFQTVHIFVIYFNPGHPRCPPLSPSALLVILPDSPPFKLMSYYYFTIIIIILYLESIYKQKYAIFGLPTLVYLAQHYNLQLHTNDIITFFFIAE
jgi:hypothetical protein